MTNNINDFYSILELSEIFKVNRETIRRKAIKNPELFCFIKNSYYLPKEKLPILKKIVETKHGKPKKELWKYSEWDKNLCHFIIKKVCLSKKGAMILKREKEGILCRISPHIPSFI